LISLYQSGNSSLHRLSAGPKLAALFVVLAAIGLSTAHPFLAATSLLFTWLLYLLAGVSSKSFLLQVWRFGYIALFVFLPQLYFGGIERAFGFTLTTLSALLLAALLSMTTRTIELVAIMQKVSRSKSFALIVALSINSIALVANLAKNIVEASAARGVKPNRIRQIVTLFVVSLKFADDYAESLAARGIRV
jgi:biotin transport system permease protein